MTKDLGDKWGYLARVGVGRQPRDHLCVLGMDLVSSLAWELLGRVTNPEASR